MIILIFGSDLSCCIQQSRDGPFGNWKCQFGAKFKAERQISGHEKAEKSGDDKDQP